MVDEEILQRRKIQNEYYARHREVKQKQARERYARNCENDSEFRKKRAEIAKRSRLKRRYGLTPEEWELLFASQNRQCKICKSSTTKGNGWHTDHCHRTDKLRSILCYNCNVMLGLCDDNIQILHSAIEYLKEHNNGKP